MKNPILLSILSVLLLAVNVQAQDKMSWKQHVKLADGLYAKGQYAEAGDHYRAAWKNKTKKTEYAYKAGQCFFLVRDYRNAADAWQHVKNEQAAFPMIGLEYGRALKQNGQYEAASSEFVNFLAQYQGADKSAVAEMAQTELRGCELAAQYTVKGTDGNMRIEHLGTNINTPETEFAPMPFGDEALYFSSTMGKRAEIYRSIKAGNIWGKASPIENFPKIESGHFCNGSLTPDASRFYFTICNDVESWGGLSSQCALYVTRRLGKSWSNPERLPDYLNEVNATTTHPCVIHDGNTEILYFASNRKGGMGGMDIWYTTREINSTANDFTLPINLGSKINTGRDEVTPSYNKVDDAIYFASNGHVSIGGFDVFMSKGAKSRWNVVENLGMPISSPADDFFFVKSTSGKGGYFVSNRLHEMQKVATTDEDIFAFEYKVVEQRWVAKGEVYNKESKEILKDVEVTLFEVAENGQGSFLDKMVSATGLYEFEVAPAKRYKIEAVKDGFFKKTYDFDTRDYADYDDFGAPIFLDPMYEGYQSEAVTSAKPSTPPPAKTPAKDTAKPSQPAKEKETAPVASNQPKATTGSDKPTGKPAAKETKPAAPPASTPQPVGNAIVEATPSPTPEIHSPEDSAQGKTATGSGNSDSIATPKAGKTYYKIQIIALSQFNQNQSRYSTVKQMGQLDTEFVSEKKLYRVLLAGYDSMTDAQNDLAKVRKNKDFSDAFLVEYQDGMRVRDIH